MNGQTFQHIYGPNAWLVSAQVRQYMDLLAAHAEELIIQGRKSGNDEDDTEEYGAVLRAGLQSLQRVRRPLSECLAPQCSQSGSS